MNAATRKTRPDLGQPGLPGEEPLDRAQIPGACWRAFSVAAFAMSRFIVDQMLRAARLFDNDVEAMIPFCASGRVASTAEALPALARGRSFAARR